MLMINIILYKGKDSPNTAIKHLVPIITQDLMDISFRDMNSTIIYPLEAIKKKIYNGYVFCSFKFDSLGVINAVRVMKSSNKVFEKYAVDALKKVNIKITDRAQIGTWYARKFIFKIE